MVDGQGSAAFFRKHQVSGRVAFADITGIRLAAAYRSYMPFCLIARAGRYLYRAVFNVVTGIDSRGAVILKAHTLVEKSGPRCRRHRHIVKRLRRISRACVKRRSDRRITRMAHLDVLPRSGFLQPHLACSCGVLIYFADKLPSVHCGRHNPGHLSACTRPQF